MSTKSTIARADTWHLYEQMMSDTVKLELNDAMDCEIRVNQRWHSVVVTIPAAVLDAIAAAKLAKTLPHQREEGGEA